MNSWNISYELNDFLRGKTYFIKTYLFEKYANCMQMIKNKKGFHL
jgi:hypothetical protein